jgi:hypothetical protein
MIKIGVFDINYQDLIVNFLDNIRDNYKFCDYYIADCEDSDRMFTLYINENLMKYYIQFDINNYMRDVVVKKMKWGDEQAPKLKNKPDFVLNYGKKGNK